MDNNLKPLEGFTGIWIPAELLSDKNLSALEMLIFAEIYALTKNEKGYCFASNNYIGWRLRGMSISTVSQHIGNLAKKKYISIEIIRSSKHQIEERRIRTLKHYLKNTEPSKDNLHTSPQNVHTPSKENLQVIDNSIIDNKIDKKEQTLLKLLPTQQEKNSKYYIENTLPALEGYYKNAVIAIHNANDDPLPSKYTDFKNDLKVWKKLEPNPELVETIKTHLENIALSARRAERFKEWQTWEEFFQDSEAWEGSDEINFRLKYNVFVPYIKRFDRYLQDYDWENVYLTLHESFWGKVAKDTINPTIQTLKKAGIKMELIQDLDYEIISKKEFNQMSFSK